MDVQLRQLRTLVAVVDAGTFTDAAAVLGVSQAAVSRSVAALESALGTRLLQRTTRHVSLTPTGARVVEQARRILDEVTHLRRLVEQSATELRVGYAWAALGRHTRRLQKRWAAARCASPTWLDTPSRSTAGPAPPRPSCGRPTHRRRRSAGRTASTSGSPGSLVARIPEVDSGRRDVIHGDLVPHVAWCVAALNRPDVVVAIRA